MALLKPSPILDSIRGPLGNVTFSRNRYGPNFSPRASHPYANSARQQTIMANHCNVVAEWRTGLLPADRQAWRRLAHETTLFNRYGQPYTPNGYTLFYTSYAFSKAIGWAIDPTLCPVVFHLPMPTLQFDTHIPTGDFLVLQFPTLPDPPWLNIAFFLSAPQPKTTYRWTGTYNFTVLWNTTNIQDDDQILLAGEHILGDRRYFIRYRGQQPDGGITRSRFAILTT